MLRRILGVILGLTGAVLTIALIERLAHQWWVPRASPLATASLLSVLLAWFMGALIGTWLATLMDPDRRSGPALWVTGILLAMTLANLVTFTHPAWFWIAGSLVYLPATWLGIRSARPAPRRG